jgi:MoaA/NifB/PqqE/SkfB family radical SAM enzyme
MFKFIAAVARANFTRPGSPFKLSYAVTYRCNLKCRMCNIWNKEHTRPEMTPDDIGRFFKKPHQVRWLGITGGEPFLRDDLPQLAEAALAPSPSLTALHVATNGTLTAKTEAFIHALRARHRKLKMVFTISIDGPQDLHDKIRGANGVWAKAIGTYRFLKTLKDVKPQFGFTLSHQNMDKFEPTFLALREAWPALRFDDVTVNIFQRSGFYYENTAMPALDDGEVARQIRRIMALDRDRPTLNNFLRRRYLMLYLKFLKTKKSPVKCQSMATTCFLDPYGDLFPCAVYQRKVVNITQTGLSLKGIWKQKEARQVHQECAANKCPSCWSPCDAYSAIGGSIVQSMVAR